MKRKFKIAWREIDYLKLAVSQKQGFWIFEAHTYTIQELLDSGHHQKILAICEKIGDDLLNWHRNGQLPENVRKVYEETRLEIEEALHIVNMKIMTRDPTWYEKIRNVLLTYLKEIINSLPILSPQLPSRRPKICLS